MKPRNRAERRKIATGTSVTGTHDFKCAFCSGECSVVEPSGVAHTQPICETFEKNGPIEFLRLQNQRARQC